jgi:hypothetical protein
MTTQPWLTVYCFGCKIANTFVAKIVLSFGGKMGLILQNLTRHAKKSKTALYMDAAFRERLEAVAQENKASLNQVCLHLIERGLEVYENKQKAA